MQDVPDMELVQTYYQQGSEEAFAELVRRHVSLVYSAALRPVGIVAQAEEITQAVFIILARKAASLRPDTVLEGWLYETTRLTASNFLREERRRQLHEQEAYMQSTLQESGEAPAWQQLAPLLEEAMSRLGKKDRDAVILRFFKGKNLGEVAAALKVTEAAAQRRVLRALEKLHRYFNKRGVSSTTAIIAGELSANSIHAAPVALAKSVTVVAVGKGAAASSSTLALIKGALKLMAWTKAKTAIVTAVIIASVAGGGAGFYAYHSTHLKPADELQAALHVERPPTGTWMYPSDKVRRAILDFGSSRATAFPILEDAVMGSNPEARMQAIAAMGLILRPAMPKYGILGEPATNAIPFLRKLLFANGDLSSFALTSLHGLFEAKDIPALANLLVESHNDQPLPKTIPTAPISRVLSLLERANVDQQSQRYINVNQQLQRYIPEAIAETIRKNAEAAAPFVSLVEDLLDDSNADIRFGAACALAKYKGVNDSKISTELTAGLEIKYDTSDPQRNPRLKPEDGLKQLMAIETLKHIGPDAKPMIPILLDYAHSTTSEVLRELAFSVAGQIDSNLRNTMPVVDQALKNDLTLKNTISPQ